MFTLPSTSGGSNATHLLLIDPANGRFRGTEHLLTTGAPALRVRYPAVLTSTTYLHADTVTAIP